MANVSVEKDVVRKSIILCNRSINEYKKAARSLVEDYRVAGGSWSDAKYRQLGGLVAECTNSMKIPVTELEECVKKLNELLKAIEKYESENI